MVHRRQDRRARHILDHYFVGPADGDGLEIWAFTDRFSFRPGDTVDLRVSTTADTWDIEIGRDGADYEPVLAASGLVGRHHSSAPDCSVVGCDWPAAYSFKVGDDWRPGGYLITLIAHRGNDSVEEHHLVFVRAAAGVGAPPIVLINATATWVSYNDWGGQNAYEGFGGSDGQQFSPRLSTLRPWTRGFCRLPAGAPRALSLETSEPGDMVRYPYMEWAYSYGYSKKYASAGWASYERHFARWAETNGFELDHLTQHDLADDPGALDQYRCAVIVGHDEYWTAGMRRAIDEWVNGGGRVARFAGNFLWQIRLEDDATTQICHKYSARQDDPVAGTEGEHLLTGAWEMEEIGWPGAATFGANGLSGIYAGLGNCAGRGPGGFTVYRPDHWAFQGAGLGYGDVLGATSQIFGYEVDGLDLVIEDGLPRATGSDGAATDIDILGVGLATMLEADHNVWGETHYIANDDAKWKAATLHGADDAGSVEATARGNGVIVSWKRGEGEVFNAATCEWVAGLLRGDQQVEQVTRNVLNRFTAEETLDE